MEDTIDEMDKNSTKRRTNKAISNPLILLLTESIDDGRILVISKIAYVTPIHKGGSKQKPEQYRPVSLTSHIIRGRHRCNVFGHIFKFIWGPFFIEGLYVENMNWAIFFH